MIIDWECYDEHEEACNYGEIDRCVVGEKEEANWKSCELKCGEEISEYFMGIWELEYFLKCSVFD